MQITLLAAVTFLSISINYSIVCVYEIIVFIYNGKLHTFHNMYKPECNCTNSRLPNKL